ncbi:IS110 family transposase, partial [Streptomyces sp. ZL-24]
MAGYGTNRASSVAGVLSEITTPTTRGPVSSPRTLTSQFHLPAQDE